MTSPILMLAKFCNGVEYAVRERHWRKKNYRSGSLNFFNRRLGFKLISTKAWKKRRSTISYKLYMKMLYNRLVNKKLTQEWRLLTR